MKTKVDMHVSRIKISIWHTTTCHENMTNIQHMKTKVVATVTETVTDTFQSGEALPSTSFWRSDDRSNEFISRSDDRSSETVWRGDDRSSDRHFFPLIDHRKQFGGEMIALMTGTFFRWSIIGKINRFAVHKSDHLPVKTFPMIDHRNAKLFPMIAQMNFKPFPMIDHRKQFEIHLSDHRNAKTMSMDELYPTE